jgi:hypothetical protein
MLPPVISLAASISSSLDICIASPSPVTLVAEIQLLILQAVQWFSPTELIGKILIEFYVTPR